MVWCLIGAKPLYKLMMTQSFLTISASPNQDDSYRPRKQRSWGQHGAHLGPVGPRLAPCWPHEPCYQGIYGKAVFDVSFQLLPKDSDMALSATIISVLPGPWFNIKMSSYRYRKSHCGDKTILRPSYLHNGISYTGETSLYWIGALVDGSRQGYHLMDHSSYISL